MSPAERAGNPGFLSSARSFAPPIGERVGDPRRPRGYHLDFSGKPREPSWPPDWLAPPERELHVSTVQWGLGAWERYVAGEGESWRAAAFACAEHLLAGQQRGGRLDGAWPHRFPMPHTYPLEPPWVSAITQGEAASLFVRLFAESDDERFADAARRALAPLRVPTGEGGALAVVEGRPFFEEYPTDSPSLVLNGAVFALLGLHDVAHALEDEEARRSFDDGSAAFVSILGRYDTGHWSLYDLYPHPIPNVASSAYHLLHIKLLSVLVRLAPHPDLSRTLERFEAYRDSRLDRARAFARKAAFRLVVPRNRILARRLPWGARARPREGNG